MNKQTILHSVTVGALGLALAALPGSSAKKQDPAASSAIARQTKVIALPTVRQDVEELQAPDGDDVEIFLGDGGSWLGVEAKEVSAELVQQLKLPSERGALVGKIVPDSPAAKAGLKENDVITEVNGQRVEGTAQFRRMIREIPAGRKIQLTIVRNGSGQTVTATLGKSESRHTLEKMGVMAPGAFAFRMPEGAEVPERIELGDMVVPGMPGLGQPRIGIDAEDLQGELGNYFGAPDGVGVLVHSVLPDSPAAKAGLKAGDVITSLNGQRVRNVHELRQQLRSLKEEKSAKVGFLRNKTGMSLDIQLPPPARKEIHTPGERATM